MTTQNNNRFRAFGLAALALMSPALPIAGVHFYNAITGQAVYQPLGSSRVGLNGFSASDARATVKVFVKWGEDVVDEQTRNEFLNRFERALKARTDNYIMDVGLVSGTDVEFYFQVGENRLGPFAPNTVADGIYEASELQDMYLFYNEE